MGGRGGHSHRATAGRGASAIDRLTSIPQMNRWLRNQDWFQPGSYISLNGVDLEAARGIAKAYQQVFDRYPQLKGIFSGIKSFNLGSGTYADCNLATGQIRVSNTMYRRLQELERSYARDIRANWHPAGTDWAAILTHEIGHAIDGYITQHSEGGLLPFRISLIRTTGLNKRIYNGSAFVIHAIFTSPHKAHRVTILVSQGLVMLEAFGFLSL